MFVFEQSGWPPPSRNLIKIGKNLIKLQEAFDHVKDRANPFDGRKKVLRLPDGANST